MLTRGTAARHVAVVLCLILIFGSLPGSTSPHHGTEHVDDEIVFLEDRVQAALGRATSPSWVLVRGGIGSDEAEIVRVDTSGNIYLAGRLCHGAGTCTVIFGSTVYNANSDIFVAKYNSTLSLQWISLSETQNTNAYAALNDMELQSDGSIVIAGRFGHSVKFGQFTLNSYSNTQDGFVARLNSQGTWLTAVVFGEDGSDEMVDLAVGPGDIVYATGHGRFYSSRPLEVQHSDYLSSSCSYWYHQGFVFRLMSDLGRDFGKSISSRASSSWSNCRDTYAYGIDVDSSGDAYVTGRFRDELYLDSSTTNLSSGGDDTFVAKISGSGDWQWVIHAGGLSDDRGQAVEIDANGTVLISGYDGNHASYGPYIILPGSGAFVAAVAPNGTWQWGTRLSKSFTPVEMTTAADGSIHLTGSTYAARLHGNGSEDWVTNLGVTVNSMTTDANSTTFYAGAFTGTQSFEGLQKISNGSNDIYLWKRDPDIDSDMIPDRTDNCVTTSNTDQENHDNDTEGDACDVDDDNDSVLDGQDTCPKGALGWNSSLTTDWDIDGCLDLTEDPDDDDDGVQDSNDSCTPPANMSERWWWSGSGTDHDGDGCKDVSEDLDDDGDGLADVVDACPRGRLDWTSSATSDHDGDGCADADEDWDDDDDGVGDGADDCPSGTTNWTASVSTDHDADGCADADEDHDDDADGALDGDDDCSRGIIGWLRWGADDHDDDGCRDSDEDDDDDNDGVIDRADDCPLGAVGWMSSGATDHDGDGCQDAGEDRDDDDDGIVDENDRCALGAVDWHSGAMTDRDADGCRDGDGNDEDQDRDGDGIDDDVDGCPLGHATWISTPSLDADGDGCHDVLEDADDDNDGIPDTQDICPFGDDGCLPSGGGGNVTIVQQTSQGNDSTTIFHHYHYNWTNSSSEMFINNTTEINATGDNASVIGDENSSADRGAATVAASGSTGFDQMTLMWIVIIVVLCLMVIVMSVGRSRSPRERDEVQQMGDLGKSIDVGGLVDPMQQGMMMGVQPDPYLNQGPSPSMSGVMGNDGFEWLEHPQGSGNHYHRAKPGSPWQRWG